MESSDFRQQVFKGGYIWDDLSSKHGGTPKPLLIDPRRTAESVLSTEEYRRHCQDDPVRSPTSGLFKRFAELHRVDLTQELFNRVAKTHQDAPPKRFHNLVDADIQVLIKDQLRERFLAFANEYGFLGVGTGLEMFGQPIHAETEDAWYEASKKIDRVWQAFNLVKLCQQDHIKPSRLRDAKESLERFYREQSNNIRGTFKLTPEGLAYCDRADRESSRGENMRNIEDAVLIYVGTIANRELGKFTSTGLTWDYSERQLKPIQRTEKLIGALWLQLIEYMTNLKGFKFCGNCPNEIPIMKVEGKRSRLDKAYCSDSCQKAARRAGKRVRESYSSRSVAK